MPSLALRSLWESGTTPPPTPVVAAGGGGMDEWPRRPRRSRVPLEQQLLALWAAGEITDDELARLLKG